MNFEKILENIKEKIPQLISDILIIVIVWIIAKLLLSRISAYTKKTMEKAEKMDDKEKGKSIITAMTMTRSIIRYVIYFIALAIILNRLGFGSVFNNMLVATGVGALVVTSGIQNIIKDFISGMILMFEKQFSVGDYVKIGEYQGTVTSIAMRVTYLDCKGKKVIIPNGQIVEVINFSTSSYSLFELTIPTPYDRDTNEIIKILTDVIDNYYQVNKDIFADKPRVYGISNFNSSSADIYINGKVNTLQQWNVERELRLAIKIKFDELNISIPYQTINCLHDEKRK